MEILTPNIETPQEPRADIPIEPSEETNENVKNIEFLALLGMKDEMFNKEVMEKIGYLSKNISFKIIMAELHQKISENVPEWLSCTKNFPTTFLNGGIPPRTSQECS